MEKRGRFEGHYSGPEDLYAQDVARIEKKIALEKNLARKEMLIRTLAHVKEQTAPRHQLFWRAES
jgi:hypothetical protein